MVSPSPFFLSFFLLFFSSPFFCAPASVAPLAGKEGGRSRKEEEEGEERHDVNGLLRGRKRRGRGGRQCVNLDQTPLGGGGRRKERRGREPYECRTR